MWKKKKRYNSDYLIQNGYLNKSITLYEEITNTHTHRHTQTHSDTQQQIHTDTDIQKNISK